MRTKELKERDKDIASMAIAMIVNQQRYGKTAMHKLMKISLANKLNNVPTYLNY